MITQDPQRVAKLAASYLADITCPSDRDRDLCHRLAECRVAAHDLFDAYADGQRIDVHRFVDLMNETAVTTAKLLRQPPPTDPDDDARFPVVRTKRPLQ